VDALATDVFAPDKQTTLRRVLAVSATGQAPPAGLPTSGASFDDGLAQIRDLLTRSQTTDQPFSAELLEGIVPDQGTLVLLKQIPDVGNGAFACYQAVVEAPTTITTKRSLVPLEGGYTLSLSALASHPINADLGLQDQQQAMLAYKAEYDFQLGAGKPV
jgi:hypothetical protein